MAIALLTLAAAVSTAPPHYDLQARFDPSGQLDADVVVTLPAGTREKSFLLGRRFKLKSIQPSEGSYLAGITRVNNPVENLNRYSFGVDPSAKGPVRIRFVYSGPISPEKDEGVKPMRPEGFELFIDHMWFPVGADIQTRFTLDARIDGLAPDMVPVAQGKVTRTSEGVRIQRDFIDIDVPLVAMRGLKQARGNGVEFYARDLTTKLSTYYIRHSEGAAAWFAKWFGPLRQTVRMAVVWRARSMAYARTGYTVFSEGAAAADAKESGSARHAAHEVAHAWWMIASPLTEDFWLVESAAEYCAIRYIEATLGAEAAEALLAEKKKVSADAGPVMGHGRPNRVQLYQKGPLLLVDLERRIGRPAMDRLMAKMAREPVHTTPVFMRLLSDEAGLAAAVEFEEALRS